MRWDWRRPCDSCMQPGGARAGNRNGRGDAAASDGKTRRQTWLKEVPVSSNHCTSASSSPSPSGMLRSWSCTSHRGLWELQRTPAPLPCHSASSAFAKRALAGPKICVTKHQPAATVLHTQSGSTLNRKGFLLPHEAILQPCG